MLRPTSVNNYQLCLPNVAPVSTSTLELLRCLAWRGQEKEVEPCTKEGREEEATLVDFYQHPTQQQLNNSRQNETFQVRISFYFLLPSSNFYEISLIWVLALWQDAAPPPPGDHLLRILLEHNPWRWLFPPIMSLLNISLLGGDFLFQQCPFSIFLTILPLKELFHTSLHVASKPVSKMNQKWIVI